MAAYPDLPLAHESTQTEVNGTVTDGADDGTPWIRDFFSVSVYRFTIIHPLISLAETQTLKAFYQSNRGKAITFIHKKDQAVYTCYFTAPPQRNRRRGSFWDARVALIGTEA